MARPGSLSTDVVAKLLRAAGPDGLAPEALEAKLADVSRSTLSRRLRELSERGLIRTQGRGRAVRYFATAPYAIEDLRRYFETPWQARAAAGFREELLQVSPGLDAARAARLLDLQGRARALDRKFLSDFLIDFSWASSLLEGSTYSNIDTEALIAYGERNPDKPVEDAVLILNHKNAIQHLWEHRDLSTENICKLQAFLTDDHGLEDVRDSDHFLHPAARGVPREYEDVHLARSAYSPPFQPATGFIARAFEDIVRTAGTLPAAQSAFHLMTRIPYLQVFANGNKRTARLAANLPLLAAGCLPISFVDFSKADYILGMAAFYELGDVQVLQDVFVEGYVRSIVRGSDVPAAMRVTGLNIDEVASVLTRYVHTGREPAGAALVFMDARRG